MSELQIDGISVIWQRKKIKNLNLSVRRSDGQVRISSPMRTPENVVRAFVVARRPWIDRHQQRFQQRQDVLDKKCLDGELHRFQGDDFPLQIIEQDGRAKVCLHNSALQLFVPASFDEAQRQRALENWYRQQLKTLLAKKTGYWQRLVGVQANEVRIRKMRSRWGTCNILAKRIWLNLELIKHPPEHLDYVLVHELTHLKERYHNERFYKLVEKAMPNWRGPHQSLRHL